MIAFDVRAPGNGPGGHWPDRRLSWPTVALLIFTVGVAVALVASILVFLAILHAHR